MTRHTNARTEKLGWCGMCSIQWRAKTAATATCNFSQLSYTFKLRGQVYGIALNEEAGLANLSGGISVVSQSADIEEEAAVDSLCTH